MNHGQQKFPFADCLVPVAGPPAQLLFPKDPGGLDLFYLLFDLNRFADRLRELGEEETISRYLSARESEYWQRLTSNKRQREWLGGRFGAKYAAAEVLARQGHPVAWSEQEIVYDQSGRPLLARGKNNLPQPGISISHSSDLAAAMAVNRGVCGIDVQKIDEKTIKVRDRFRTDREELILASFFSGAPLARSALLTLLWSAKETLRKIGKSTVPGFLELELKEIREVKGDDGVIAWRFDLVSRNQDPMSTKADKRKYSVALVIVADYALALTAVNDIKA